MTWVVVMMARGGGSLPTRSVKDRPIIGILAQEIHGTLADVAAEILLSNNRNSRFVLLKQESPADSFQRHEYNGETLPGYYSSLGRQMEEEEEEEEEEEDSKYQWKKEEETNRITFRESKTKTQSSINVSQEPGETSSSTASSSSFSFSSVLETSNSSSSVSLESTTTPPHPPLPKNVSYIAASYVKFIEAAGARVVPIFIDRDRVYYEQLLKSINGVLFPGGAVAIDETSAFGRAGKIIFEIAKGMNDVGDTFPLWGTCLGFELMLGLAANGQEIRVKCDAQNTANHLELDAEYADGYLLRHIPKDLLKALVTKPITGNFHRYCVTPQNFNSFGVNRTYRALAYSADRNGVKYVAAVEAREYPFFAVQFHPEKSPYEWTTKHGHDHIPHSSAAIETANYFAQVFVNFARRNQHHFPDPTEEAARLIYNYWPIYTGQLSPFEQMYIF